MGRKRTPEPRRLHRPTLPSEFHAERSEAKARKCVGLFRASAFSRALKLNSDDVPSSSSLSTDVLAVIPTRQKTEAPQPWTRHVWLSDTIVARNLRLGKLA